MERGEGTETKLVRTNTKRSTQLIRCAFVSIDNDFVRLSRFSSNYETKAVDSFCIKMEATLGLF